MIIKCNMPRPGKQLESCVEKALEPHLPGNCCVRWESPTLSHEPWATGNSIARSWAPNSARCGLFLNVANKKPVSGAYEIALQKFHSFKYIELKGLEKQLSSLECLPSKHVVMCSIPGATTSTKHGLSSSPVGKSPPQLWPDMCKQLNRCVTSPTPFPQTPLLFLFKCRYSHEIQPPVSRCGRTAVTSQRTPSPTRNEPWLRV